jgi:ADP-heptose:LPS heptosyltransferase
MARTVSDCIGVAPLRPDAGLALALIARADLLLSPDTFAVHAASAFNIPVVAVYPGDAHTLVTWAPRSDLQLQLVAPPGAALADHDPLAVVAACLALLQQSRERQS